MKCEATKALHLSFEYCLAFFELIIICLNDITYTMSSILKRCYNIDTIVINVIREKVKIIQNCYMSGTYKFGKV